MKLSGNLPLTKENKKIWDLIEYSDINLKAYTFTLNSKKFSIITFSWSDDFTVMHTTCDRRFFNH